MAEKLSKDEDVKSGGREILEGIDLKALPVKDIIDFEGDCFDPYVLMVITESLDYAVETAGRRLGAMNKIFPGSGIARGSAVGLAFIDEIRKALITAPVCTPEQKKPITPFNLPPLEMTAPFSDVQEKEEARTTLKKMAGIIPAKKTTVAVREELAAKIEAAQVAEKRELPANYHIPIFFENKKWGPETSPTEVGREIGISMSGCHGFKVKGEKGELRGSGVIDCFRRAGFKVYDGKTERTKENPGDMTSGEFRIVRVNPTPEQYKYKGVPVNTDITVGQRAAQVEAANKQTEKYTRIMPDGSKIHMEGDKVIEIIPPPVGQKTGSIIDLAGSAPVTPSAPSTSDVQKSKTPDKDLTDDTLSKLPPEQQAAFRAILADAAALDKPVKKQKKAAAPALPAGTRVVFPGDKVTVRDANGVIVTITIANIGETADPANLILDAETPTAKCFRGHAVGETLECITPEGKKTFGILKIEAG